MILIINIDVIAALLAGLLVGGLLGALAGWRRAIRKIERLEIL